MLRALKFVKVPGFRIYKQSIPRIKFRQLRKPVSLPAGTRFGFPRI